MSNTNVLTLIGALLAGYFLLALPLGGTFLAAFGPAVKIIAILTVLVFGAVLIYKGLKEILRK
ncbi:hypothetical protein ABID52_003683 [Fictibacillus halophilus]|jgi:hypothetical protein|uniref:Uncharacterized protein n=3 Tax=Fictibacillus TaxID=1329200 RepID=A0A160IJW0_9BACL|nr:MULTISPECIES: hypothetical protein [Fictibacillus]ANC75650.1 hypothetical protein ABE65_001860 [Fictibacillus phosphorivorans]MBH0158162.1 hypothetical protein [Fictibacillus sp. 5RED26]MBH0162792.1 hypothetical protein [Fictibacillus sp. 26RED30]MBH0167013.1 hypothetical protein [Fictibacillus sp. 7GRE50]MBH0174890.1 hypothetical protein [Fictibacillus sp. 23RED33]